MTLTRSPIQRHAKLGARPKSNPRRVRHPFPIPDGDPVTFAEVEEETVAFGPQAKLCERTRCAACFYVEFTRGLHGTRAIDWAKLETYHEPVNVAHHEPHRSTTCKSTDRDTYPLCRKHHTDGVGDCVRHRRRSDKTDARAFYRLLPFDWRAVVAEMRRRVAAQNPQPVIDTTASETS